MTNEMKRSLELIAQANAELARPYPVRQHIGIGIPLAAQCPECGDHGCPRCNHTGTARGYAQAQENK